MTGISLERHNLVERRFRCREKERQTMDRKDTEKERIPGVIPKIVCTKSSLTCPLSLNERNILANLFRMVLCKFSHLVFPRLSYNLSYFITNCASILFAALSPFKLRCHLHKRLRHCVEDARISIRFIIPQSEILLLTWSCERQNFLSYSFPMKISWKLLE